MTVCVLRVFVVTHLINGCLPVSSTVLISRVEETEVETQTDAFLDRPPSPMFIPVKSGVDVWTQIENGEV